MLLRGHSVNPWDLRPWERLQDRYDVSVVVTGSNEFDTSGLALPAHRLRTLRDRLPAGRAGRALAYAAGERYVGLERVLQGADIVHAAEIHSWFSAQAATLRDRLGFRLALTVWETIPFLEALRWPRERRYRHAVLPAADLLLPATERARRALLLEGVGPERIRVCHPGIDTERFEAAAGGHAAADRPAGEHLILSPGRLVWEKGHQDVMRALALLHRGEVRTPAGEVVRPRLLIVGSGPERERLRAYAADLGLSDAVEIRAVPYEEMPGVFASASVMVLASQAIANAALYLFDIPRAFWEEQFGLVLAEAMAAGLAIVTTTSGAIPEVVDGAGVELVAPGDWPAIARALANGALSRPPAARVAYPPQLLERYSTGAAARRLADVYDRLLAA